MPTLNRFASETRNEGIVVAAVSVDRNEQAYRHFLQAIKPAFSTFRDPASDVPYLFGTYKIPETYVIDRWGRVRRKYISYQNWLAPSIANDIRGLLSDCFRQLD
jgi:thiol-disulfide isomerase/thioredoxin